MSESAAGPRRILVTGATGFIGRRLMRRLIAEFGAASIACLVKPGAMPFESAALESYRADGVRLIEGDLLHDPVASVPLMAVDLVFHLAANIDTDATEEEARVNDVGTRNLLDWLRPVSRGARLVYTSSVAVHDRDRHPQGPISETSPTVPRTVYGQTKLEGERIIRSRADADGYSWTIVRLPTVYGPGQKSEGLFDKMLRWASEGALLGRIDWPGRTSIIYVDDAADVMADFATRGDTGGEVYCLASDENLTVGELAQKVGQFIGKPVSPIGIPATLLPAMRQVAWNRTLSAVMPRFARVSFWRLSLIVSDGFWFTTVKLREAYRKPLRSLEEGLAAMSDETGENQRRRQRAASSGDTI
jgi:nucleoside-diphosphate-sugar epimerase